MTILKISKPHLLPNGKSDWAETWWEALRRHGDSKLLKPFCYYIHDGRHSSHHEGLQLLAQTETLFQVSLCRLLLTVLRPSSVCHSVTFHIFDISVMDSTATILKVFNGYLLPNGKSNGAETWWKVSGQHGNLELLKWFRSNIQDGHHSSHLENLKITSVPER